jgi:hypothetical protein
MKKLVLMLSTLVAASLGLSQNRACVRIVPMDELARGASFIGRVKVTKVESINYRGMYAQLATVVPTEVIDGDFTIKKLNILARSNVPCAEDNYVVGQEMLVFLVPEDSLFKTFDFQYGQFLIVGNVVRGWRDKANKPVDKLYGEAEKEVEYALNPTQPPAGENNPPRTPMAGDPPGSPPAGSQVLPAAPGVLPPSPTPTPRPPKQNKKP